MKKIFYVIALFGMLIGISACKTEHTHNIVSYEAKEPTCTEEGHKAYEECTECDYTTYEKVDALGHSLLHYEIVEATCTETGKKEHWYCPDCGKYFIDSEGKHATLYEDLTIDKVEHLDENYDYLCDYECGEVLLVKDTLQQIIENTLSSTKVTANEWYIPSNTKTSYYFDSNLLYMNVNEGETEKYYYTEGDTTYLLTKNETWIREITTEKINFFISYLFEDKFNLEIASDIDREICGYGPLEGKIMFQYENSLGTKVDIVFNEDKTLLDGIYIHDESGNIIYTYEFNYGEDDEVIAGLETRANCFDGNHNFSNEWSFDEEGHYHKCQNVDCTIIDITIEHSFIGNCIDSNCEVCGYRYSGNVVLDSDIHVSYDENTGKCECGKIINPYAQIGSLYYENFDLALENWKDGTTLTLLADVIDLTERITTIANGIVLDLNGKTMASTVMGSICVEGGSLTIRDSVGTGSILVSPNYYAALIVDGDSVVNFESGMIRSIRVGSGTFNMTGGKTCQESSPGVYVLGKGNAFISGGEIIGDTGIWNSYGNVIITGAPKIVGTEGYAIRNFENLTILGTPIFSGATGEIITSKKIMLHTQPIDGNKWRIAIETDDITNGIFAIPGENFEFDVNKLPSAMEGYDVEVNDKGELLLCNHATSYHSVTNGDGTHNKTCICENYILETNISCTGGIATDTHLAICEYCGEPYGELDPNNHYDIVVVNMNEDELYNAVLELIQSGDTDISIFFDDINEELYDAINRAIKDSNVEEDSIHLTLVSTNGVENEQQLVKANEKGGIILINGDIELSELNSRGIDITKDTTIILNGYTIKGVYGTFSVDGATLTILGEGTITMIEENQNFGFTINVTNKGVLNLQNALVKGWLNVEYGGIANINGGFVDILCCYGGAINITNGSIERVDCLDGTITINGGTITGKFWISGGSVTITGGTFNFDPSEYVDLEKYTVTENEGVYIVTAK